MITKNLCKQHGVPQLQVPLHTQKTSLSTAMVLAEAPIFFKEDDKRKRDRELLIKTRLMHVYRFAQQFIGDNHLDIGTYDGFALSIMADMAQHLTSFDINADILKVAIRRPDVIKLLTDKRLTLLQMDARQIGLPDKHFDSATLVEVLGGAFEGTRDDIYHMFTEAERVLKKGAPLIFTIKSQSNEQILKQYFDWDIPKGYPQYRLQMEELLVESGFGLVDWYGHVFMNLTEQGNPILPLRVTKEGGVQQVELDEKYFIPQAADIFETDEQSQLPLYWIGVAKTLY